MKFIIFLFYMLISFFAIVCDNDNITQGKTYKIIWNNENSGLLILEPDEFLIKHNEYKFDNYSYIQSQIDIPGQPTVINKRLLNRSCSQEVLDDFASKIKWQIICIFWRDIDIEFLFNNGFLKEGRDYIKQLNGSVTIIGEINFILKNKSVTPMIENDKIVWETSPETFRITKVSEKVILTTCWETGNKTVEIID